MQLTSGLRRAVRTLQPSARSLRRGSCQALAPASNLLHLLATATWIGGIFYFVVILLPGLHGLADGSRGALLRETITRFSQLALVTVPLVALSGTIIYLAEQPSVEGPSQRRLRARGAYQGWPVVPAYDPRLLQPA